jgi:hypothetical protein
MYETIAISLLGMKGLKCSIAGILYSVQLWVLQRWLEHNTTLGGSTKAALRLPSGFVAFIYNIIQLVSHKWRLLFALENYPFSQAL